jgi:hypothetical protein
MRRLPLGVDLGIDNAFTGTVDNDGIDPVDIAPAASFLTALSLSSLRRRAKRAARVAASMQRR